MEALGLDNISLVWIVLPFVIGAITYTKIVNHKTGDPLRDNVKNVQIMLLIFGVLLAVMMFSLPSTPSLSTFGYPETVEDINNPEKVLKLLQRYNKATVRTIEIVHWLLFISIFWILTAVYQLLQAYRNKLDKETVKQHETTN